SPAGSASRWRATSSRSMSPAPPRWCASTGLVAVPQSRAAVGVPHAVREVAGYRSEPLGPRSTPSSATRADNAVQQGAYSALPDWGPSSDPVPAVPGVNAEGRFYGVSGPAVD